MSAGKRLALVFAIAAILLAGYASTLGGMVTQWWTDEDMGHGFVVPLAIGWIVWRERARWRALPVQPSTWGFVLLAAGAGMQAVSALGAGLFAGCVGFLLSVAGVVLWVGGVAFLRAWIFPLLLCIFMLPKLAVAYNQATLPLQLMASKLAAGMLSAAGIGVIREGNILDVRGHTVLVAEACNGIRYLLPLGFLALVFGYFEDAKPGMRAALLVAAVPLAIVANAARVAVSASLPALDAGTPHLIAGWLIFVLCLATLVLARRVFQRVFARYHA